MRVMSRRFVTSRASRSDWSSMSSRSSARSSSPRWASTWRRLDTAVLIEASGVRRSCDAAPMRALRQRSISSSRRARNACSRSWARSTASAAWLAKVPSRLRSRSPSCTSWSTSIPTGRWLTTSATDTRRGPDVVHQPEGFGLTAPGGDRGNVRVRQGLAGRGGDAQHAAPGATPPGPPSGSTRAVQRAAKTLCKVSTMCVSSWVRVRSPMSAWDNSNNRSDSSVRRSASSRALLSLATTWATISTTTA